MLAAALATVVLAAGSASADPGAVAAKEAEARQVLGQIEAIDHDLEGAVEAYNLAGLRLQRIQGDLDRNRQDLAAARSNLRHSQRALSARLVAIYTGGPQASTVEVLLGSASLDDLINRIDSVNRVSGQDASVIHEVTGYRAAVRRHELELEHAHAEQSQVVAARSAAKSRIEGQLAERRQLLSSIQGQIERLRAEERARAAAAARAARRRLAAAAAAERAAATAARAAAAARPASSARVTAVSPPAEPAAPPETAEPVVGVAAATPEGATVAPPARYGGVVGIAMQYLGVPYRWGGADPSGFDCSGFIMYVYAQMGVSLPHFTGAQYSLGTPVSRDQLEPGDLVFFNGLGHAGIYIGGGQFVHSPHTGDVVKVTSLDESWYASTWVGARRIT